eukprot:m.259383 g.259383  ORF g.259383 m.259383 type:complete len:361 (-) comp37964_c0_seq1:421-1503(-)
MSDAIWSGNPYANLPTTNTKEEATSSTAANAKPEKPKSRKRQIEDEEKQIKEWGWNKVPSSSHPGRYVYLNKHTKEKIGWVPDRPASKKRKDLPPAPKIEKKRKIDSNLDPEEKLKKDQQSLKIALGKIRTVFATENTETEDNFKLACKLLHKAFSSSAALSGDTKADYFETLACTQAKPERVVLDKYRGVIKSLFRLIDKTKDKFDDKHKYQLDTWMLRCQTHLLLFTDDTYQYNKAAKKFIDTMLEIDLTNKKRIKELEGTDQDHETIIADPKLVTERRQVILEIMPTLVSQAKLPWAVATVKNMFKEITDRRATFTEAQKTLIDDANDALQTKLNAARPVEVAPGLMQGRVLARKKF